MVVEVMVFPWLIRQNDVIGFCLSCHQLLRHQIRQQHFPLLFLASFVIFIVLYFVLCLPGGYQSQKKTCISMRSLPRKMLQKLLIQIPISMKGDLLQNARDIFDLDIQPYLWVAVCGKKLSVSVWESGIRGWNMVMGSQGGRIVTSHSLFMISFLIFFSSKSLKENWRQNGYMLRGGMHSYLTFTFCDFFIFYKFI